VLDFSYGKEHVWDGLRGAMELAGRIARDSGGMVWDAEGRKVLTPEEWDRKSLAAWQAGSVADCRQLFNIDVYKDGEYLREVTLGMKKLGLPDLVAEELPASLYESTGNLINTLAQALAEGGTPGKEGELDLSLRSLQNAEVRTSMLGRVLGQGAERPGSLSPGRIQKREIRTTVCSRSASGAIRARTSMRSRKR
jgi:hypothetical protein